MSKGMVHIYTGDGKGKTTCAIGLAIRCAGYGKKVKFFQFLKATPTGELSPLEKAGVETLRINSCEKFYCDMTDVEKHITKTEIENQLCNIFSEKCDLIILDEIICVAANEIITIEKIIEIIKSKPQDTELVLTGRNMPDSLLQYADYVSEIKCIKHPYSNGTQARYGIDF